jgi:hypothetical protein
MIADQRDFVAWWRDNVAPGQSPGSNQWSNAGRHGTISMAEAEQLTGVQQWQVSRWRTARPPPAASGNITRSRAARQHR